MGGGAFCGVENKGVERRGCTGVRKQISILLFYTTGAGDVKMKRSQLMKVGW
jgi:hypothetical protein